MAAAAAVTGSLPLTVGCRSSNSSSGSASGNTGSGTNWANYGTIMKDFTAKYGIKINDANPVTRVGVRLSGDVAVQVDRPSAEAAALAPGASVAMSLSAQPVLVAARRVS